MCYFGTRVLLLGLRQPRPPVSPSCSHRPLVVVEGFNSGGQSAALALAAMLRLNTSLRALELSDNRFTRSAFAALCRTASEYGNVRATPAPPSSPTAPPPRPPAPSKKPPEKLALSLKNIFLSLGAPQDTFCETGYNQTLRGRFCPCGEWPGGVALPCFPGEKSKPTSTFGAFWRRWRR